MHSVQDLPEQTAVILAIGEITDRPETPAEGREPVALMAAAMRLAEADGAVLRDLDSIDLVGQMTWRYRDPVGLLCQRLGIAPARQINASMGGETPIRLLHEAALRIERGESQVAAVVSGESWNALGKARQAEVKLNWTPLVSRADSAKLDFEKLPLSRGARLAGATDPVHIYPFYETATQAALAQTPAEGRRAAAELWARYAAVAATNPYAWMRRAPNAEEIASPGEQNRMVSFPYPKLMVANPSVNQAAAVIVTSLARARAAGVDESRLVYFHGGAAAQEPEDFLLRDVYTHSTAQAEVLREAVALGGGDAAAFDMIELYSCFPIVPKLALATLYPLGLPKDVPPSVTGGLTFFGGPFNSHMSHAVCEMVRRLRGGAGRLGLLYGQGGVVSKHHALVISSQPPATSLAAAYSVQARADATRGPVPATLDSYSGAATIEAYTVVYGGKGQALHGIVIARTPAGERLIAKARRDDEASLTQLTALNATAVGMSGHVRVDAFGWMVWESGAPRDRRAAPKKFCTVEHDGRLTIITINRPEALNALHPMANEELVDVFDDFQADPEQWVAIITGAGGKAFSAGNDLKYTAEAMARGESVPMPVAGWAGLTSRWNLTKPVIAAVQGIAMGGGMEIALACDLIIASDDAVFGLPEVKVGLAALAGGLHRLPRQIGLKQAMDIILTGRRVPAAEAKALGFVNEVTDAAGLMAAARRWAGLILANSPMSVRASKEAVNRGFTEASLKDAVNAQTAYPAMTALFRSEDVREGPTAFAQKRPPRWKGR